MQLKFLDLPARAFWLAVFTYILAAFLLVPLALAQPAPSQIVGCVFLSSPATLADKQTAALNCDQLQQLKTSANGTVPSGSTDSGNPVKIGGVFNTTPPTFTNGQRGDVQIGSRGSVKVELFSPNSTTGATVAAFASDGVVAGSFGNGLGAVAFPHNFNGTSWDRQRGDINGAFSQGNVVNAGTDAGNPVKVGGVFNSTLPTVTTGQRVDAQSDANGGLRVRLTGTLSAGADALTNNMTFAQTSQDSNAAKLLGVGPSNFNGSTWDREFTCPLSAVVNATAGTTQQLVALSASTIIRVCSIVLTANVAGTAQLQYGTGALCATGNTNLTGAMNLAAATPLAISSGNGSLVRGAAANALCLAPVTANITGFVTYAQY